MAALRRFVLGLLSLLRRHRAERELDDEVRAYVEASVEHKVRGGLPLDSALRAARIEIGSLEGVKDRVRDAGWEMRLENAWRDVHYAARLLRKSPGFTAAAVVTLALGIGANTAIVSAVNAIMLRELPVERPDELVSVAAIYPGGADPTFSYAAYRRIAADGARLIDAMAASPLRRDAVAFDGPPEPTNHKWVSGNYFTGLGIPAALGRTLLPSDDRLPPGEPVAVLSNAYWTRRFGHDPMVIGRAFRLKGRTFTVVGVAPQGFLGESPGEAVDLWMPVSAQPGAPPWLWTGHSTTWLRILARRRPGVSLAQARAGLEPVYDQVRNEIAAGTGSANFRASVLASRLAVSEASGGASRLRDNLTAPLLILLAISGLVLLVACANVANLTLARAAARRRQAALCLALGAGRTRLVGQSMTEALMLAAFGGIGGLCLAVWSSSVLEALVSAALPVALDVSPDRRVFAFAVVASGTTAVLFGLLPGLRTARIDPLEALKAGAASACGSRRVPLGRTLVVAQIVVSLVLVVAAGLFGRSLLKLQAIDPGFDPDRVLLLRVVGVGAETSMTPPADDQPVSPEIRRHLYRQLLTRAEMVPGVDGASASFTGVFGRETWGNAITVEGRAPNEAPTLRTFANSVTPRYFEVMRIALLRGRPFTDADHESAPKVVVVNETFARQFLGGTDPIGRRVAFCTSDPCQPATADKMAIVGLAEDAKYVDLREDRRPMLYVPFTQVRQHLGELQVRTASDPASVAATIYRELATVDRRLAVVAMTGGRDHVNASLVAERLIAKLSVTFACLALALAAVGLYGLMAYVTTQRTGEIGIRLSLGAEPGDVRRLVLGDTCRLVAIGAAIGTPAALAASMLLSSQLYQVGPGDPIVVALSVLALSVVAISAAYLPARRAAGVDPVRALRAE